MFCKECGKEYQKDERFCENCGSKISKDVKLGKINTKIIGIIIAILLVVLFIVAITVILNKKKSDSRSENDYRVIKLESYEGQLSLERNGKDNEIFEGMKLKSKDTVTTGEDSMAVLLLDSDKHIGAKENTSFNIIAKGNEDDGKVSIELVYGEALFTIDNKLPEDSTFEVNTPNASLSVRGTEFITKYDNENHETYVEVISGLVWISNGEYEIILEAGQYGLITDDNTKEFEYGYVENNPIIADDENDLCVVNEEDSEEEIIIDEKDLLGAFEPESVYVFSEGSAYSDGSGRRRVGQANHSYGDYTMENVTIYLQKQGDSYIVSFGGELEALGTVEAKLTQTVNDTYLSGSRYDRDVDEKVSVKLDFIKGTYSIDYDSIEWYTFQFGVNGKFEPGMKLANDVDEEKWVIAKINGEKQFDIVDMNIQVGGSPVNYNMDKVSYKLVRKNDKYVFSFLGQLESIGSFELKDEGNGRLYYNSYDTSNVVDTTWGSMNLSNMDIIIELDAYEVQFYISGSSNDGIDELYIMGNRDLIDETLIE